MGEVHGNPCKGCAVNCCIKMGLLLSTDEFNRHFISHAEDLIVRRSNNIFVLLPKEGHACPHFENGGCGIYHERPIDCQVYPYVIRHVIEKRKKVKIVFHTRSDCPQKSILYALVKEAQARALIVKFGKQLYGANKPIVVHREDSIVSQWLNRFDAAIYRRWNRLRKRVNGTSVDSK